LGVKTSDMSTASTRTVRGDGAVGGSEVLSDLLPSEAALALALTGVVHT
jgi:hypothetical protein